MIGVGGYKSLEPFRVATNMDFRTEKVVIQTWYMPVSFIPKSNIIQNISNNSIIQLISAAFQAEVI